MGASSSGLLDEAKTSHIKGLVDSSFKSFSVFYRQQYPAAYFRHLQQEVEPKKQERGLLLTQRPRSDPEEVLYEGRARFSTWDDLSKKGKEKYIVLKRNYSLEIHESQETFLRGSAAKLVLQSIGGAALTSVEEARTLLDQSCSGILDGVKEDPASPPEGFAVHLHLPHTGLYCFLFQQENERHHFLSTLRSCIRHQNLDPWSEASYESQAFVHALRLYRLDKGCYECWEMLLGCEEQVLAAQLMEEVLPWLQSQLQNKVKSKKMERIRLWLATVHAAYTVVLEQLKTGLEALREECQVSASASQGLIRSNLDQITASHAFLLNKIQDCVNEEAERALSEFISPYLPSVLEALTENISPALQEMRTTLQAQIDSALAEKGGGTEVTREVSSLTKTGLEKCYQQVERLKQDLSNLRERFGLNTTERLVHAAHLDMEKLLDSAVYTFELFLRTSARLQADQYSVKTNRAKERVLKQLDYDSRLVQKRLYEEALLQIALPTLSRRVDSTWKNELQTFEQYIFSDFSSFILVPNVYQDVLRGILNKEIQKVLQEATSKTSSTLLLDTSDLALSQYSLLEQTPTPSIPNSPTLRPRDIPSTVPIQDADSTQEKSPISETDSGIQISQVKELATPVIVVTQEISNYTADSGEIQSDPVMDLLQYESSDSESVKIWEEISDSDPLEVLESLTSFEDALEEVPQSHSPEITINTQEVTINTQEVTINTPEITINTMETNNTPETTINTMETNNTPETTTNTQEITINTPEITINTPEITINTMETNNTPETTINTPETTISMAETTINMPETSNTPETTINNIAEVEHLENLPEDTTVCQSVTFSISANSQEEYPEKISLETLSEAIVCDATENVMYQSTDKAVYLKGPIKENWQLESQKEGIESDQSVSEDCSIEQNVHDGGIVNRQCVEKVEERVDNAEVINNNASSEKGELAFAQQKEIQNDNNEKQPLDSVAAIRDLVTEVTEVEITINPCPSTAE